MQGFSGECGLALSRRVRHETRCAEESSRSACGKIRVRNARGSEKEAKIIRDFMDRLAREDELTAAASVRTR